jgi:hypothetical protein
MFYNEKAFIHFWWCCHLVMVFNLLFEVIFTSHAQVERYTREALRINFLRRFNLTVQHS